MKLSTRKEESKAFNVEPAEEREEQSSFKQCSASATNNKNQNTLCSNDTVRRRHGQLTFNIVSNRREQKKKSSSASALTMLLLVEFMTRQKRAGVVTAVTLFSFVDTGPMSLRDFYITSSYIE